MKGQRIDFGMRKYFPPVGREYSAASVEPTVQSDNDNASAGSSEYESSENEGTAARADLLAVDKISSAAEEIQERRTNFPKLERRVSKSESVEIIPPESGNCWHSLLPRPGTLVAVLPHEDSPPGGAHPFTPGTASPTTNISPNRSPRKGVPDTTSPRPRLQIIHEASAIRKAEELDRKELEQAAKDIKEAPLANRRRCRAREKREKLEWTHMNILSEQGETGPAMLCQLLRAELLALSGPVLDVPQGPHPALPRSCSDSDLRQRRISSESSASTSSCSSPLKDTVSLTASTSLSSPRAPTTTCLPPQPPSHPPPPSRLAVRGGKPRCIPQTEGGGGGPGGGGGKENIWRNRHLFPRTSDHTAHVPDIAAETSRGIQVSVERCIVFETDSFVQSVGKADIPIDDVYPEITNSMIEKLVDYARMRGVGSFKGLFYSLPAAPAKWESSTGAARNTTKTSRPTTVSTNLEREKRPLVPKTVAAAAAGAAVPRIRVADFQLRRPQSQGLSGCPSNGPLGAVTFNAVTSSGGGDGGGGASGGPRRVDETDNSSASPMQQSEIEADSTILEVVRHSKHSSCGEAPEPPHPPHHHPSPPAPHPPHARMTPMSGLDSFRASGGGGGRKTTDFRPAMTYYAAMPGTSQSFSRQPSEIEEKRLRSRPNTVAGPSQSHAPLTSQQAPPVTHTPISQNQFQLVFPLSDGRQMAQAVFGGSAGGGAKGGPASTDGRSTPLFMPQKLHTRSAPVLKHPSSSEDPSPATESPAGMSSWLTCPPTQHDPPARTSGVSRGGELVRGSTTSPKRPADRFLYLHNQDSMTWEWSQSVEVTGVHVGSGGSGASGTTTAANQVEDCHGKEDGNGDKSVRSVAFHTSSELIPPASSQSPRIHPHSHIDMFNTTPRPTTISSAATSSPAANSSSLSMRPMTSTLTVRSNPGSSPGKHHTPSHHGSIDPTAGVLPLTSIGWAVSSSAPVSRTATQVRPSPKPEKSQQMKADTLEGEGLPPGASTSETARPMFLLNETKSNPLWKPMLANKKNSPGGSGAASSAAPASPQQQQNQQHQQQHASASSSPSSFPQQISSQSATSSHEPQQQQPQQGTQQGKASRQHPRMNQRQRFNMIDKETTLVKQHMKHISEVTKSKELLPLLMSSTSQRPTVASMGLRRVRNPHGHKTR